MVATNLMGRGIDIERVNVVINYDMPGNAELYLHRVRSLVFSEQRSLLKKEICRLPGRGDLEPRASRSPS